MVDLLQADCCIGLTFNGFKTTTADGLSALIECCGLVFVVI